MNTNVGIRLLMVQGHCTWQARRFNALGKGPWGERAPCGGEFASVMTPGAGQMLARGIAMPRRIGRCRGVSPLRASASDQPSRGSQSRMGEVEKRGNCYSVWLGRRAGANLGQGNLSR